MRSFREMNPTRLGIISLCALAAIIVVLFNTTAFPQLTGGTRYRAGFANAGGLQSGDAVRMHGVKVGEVNELTLSGGRVVVTFDMADSDTKFGAKSRLSIKTGTLLGRKFLSISPEGSALADDDEVIPVSQTDVPYRMTDQLGKLATTTGRIDVNQLADALDAMSASLAGSAPEMQGALKGLRRLSKSISSRDEEIQQLLGSAESVTGVLADRNKQLSRLFVDGNLLLSELETRRQAIHNVLVNVEAMADQLSGLVQDNRGQLGPALAHLDSVLNMLRENEGNIAAAIQQLGPYATRLGGAISNGPFWNAYIQNLIPGNLIPLPKLPGSKPAKSSGGN